MYMKERKLRIDTKSIAIRVIAYNLKKKHLMMKKLKVFRSQIIDVIVTNNFKAELRK